MSGSPAAVLIRQHLIDPETCIRCNTCEETCPVGAISHDRHNYVVNVDVCEWCQACIEPCPTGAIDNYRVLGRDQAYGLTQQLAWDALPAPTAAVAPQAPVPHHDHLVAPAPASAAVPAVNLFPPGHPLPASLLDRRRINAANAESEVWQLLLALPADAFPLLEGQSLGIVAPGLDGEGRPHAMRLYSVASARDGEDGQPGQVAIAVKRVTHSHEGKPAHGICSNYLCDLAPGAALAVHGPFGQRFLMPEDAASRLVLIGTGTGLAPLRAMIERRSRHPQRYGGAPMVLFAGARSAADLPWLNELLRRPAGLLRTHFAFSRVAGQPRQYVQDRLLEEHAAIYAALCAPTSYFYLCGRKGMEAGVHAALAEICRRHGDDWAARLPELAAAGRFHSETY